MNEQKYPRGKAEFSSFEESDREDRLKWATMTVEERMKNYFNLLALCSDLPSKVKESGNEFLLKKIK